MLAGMSVLVLATLFQGSFGICFKKYQPFSWEAFWALFSLIGVLVMPHVWCALCVPDYLSYLTATPLASLMPAIVAGFFWGVSAIWYSLAIDRIGVSLVTGINLGLSNLLGSIVPMFVLDRFPSPRALTLLLAGQAVLLGGVALLSKAGFMKTASAVSSAVSSSSVASFAIASSSPTDVRDDAAIPPTAAASPSTEASSASRSTFLIGFAMALASGAGSAAINIGGTFAAHPVTLAEQAGVAPMFAALLQWPIVFLGGFLANFGYALITLIRNRTFADYVRPGCALAYGKALLTSFVWFAALGVYAMATALLGDFGQVGGWVVFNGCALIVANLWGFRDGEWTGFPKARSVALAGNAVIVASLIVVGIANGMA